MEEARICFIDPLGLDSKKFVFFPLNSSKEMEKAGGYHWSLLVLNAQESNIVHYDSIAGGSNESEANFFFQKYKSVFKSTKLVNAIDFPQQSNSSDCGVFVCGKKYDVP